MALFRAQVLLDTTQHDDLQRLAAESGKSMSELLREILAGYLDEVSREESVRRSLLAVDRLGEIRSRIETRCGVLESSFLEETRDERDVEIASR